jgi:hypothetical protein
MRSPLLVTAVIGALEYVARVFAAGFVLGTVRELWVRPSLGVRAAELLELPLMLMAVVLAASAVDRRWLTGCRANVRLRVGILALALLLAAEVGLGMALRGLTAREALLDKDPVSGTGYYLSLLVFAAMPWYLGRRPPVPAVPAPGAAPPTGAGARR